MKFICCLMLVLLTSSSSQNLMAQDNALLACETADTPNFLAPPVSNIETYYQGLIKEQGRNERYRACDLALQKYGCDKEEYSAKLYNLLAEEAFLMRDYEQAKWCYNTVITTIFVDDYFAQGLIADRAKLAALVGLRTIAMEEKDYEAALVFHQSYVDSLEKDWSIIAKRNKLTNDKIFATCYQNLEQSEQAIHYLMPYAFGNVSENYGAIDKQTVDYLTDLLRTKYPKKVYEKFLRTVANQIYTEQKNGRVLFYLKILDNRIYFQNDSANFEVRVAQNETLVGQGIAHYQRKLLNSYFYQSLLR